MSKDKISDYSATANSNTDIGGINIDEGCAPSGINDAIRTLMKQLKDWQSGSQDVYIHPAGSASVPSITATGDTNTGMFFPAADTVGITTGGTERARVDSSGNLGLGVTPSAWSSVFKAIELGGGTSYLTFNSTTASGYVYWNMWNDGTNNKTKQTGYIGAYGYNISGEYVWFNGSGTTGATASLTQAMTLTASGNLGLGTTNPNVAGGTRAITLDAPTAGNYSGFELMTGGTLRAKFIGNSSQTYFGTETATPLIFVMGNSEKARIDTDGNFLVGASSIPTGSSSFASGNSIYAGGNILINNNGGTSTYFFRLDGYVNSIYGLWSNGSTDAGVKLDYGSTSWASSSDERLKDIIEPITNAVEKVCTLRSVIGKYKTDEADKRRAFLIAQDVQAVLPEAVSESAPPNVEDTNLWLNYQDVIPLLVAAIKEQQAIITQLQADVAALKG